MLLKNVNQSLNAIKAILCSFVLIVSTMGTAWAQNLTVTGKVTDVLGEPIVGTYVFIEGTRIGTSTDFDGNYSLNNVPRDARIQFTFMGYKEQIVNVAGRAVINIVMEDDSEMLEDVVVTALGIKKERKALGYSVQDIKSEEILKNKTANVINSLSGKIAGVNVTQSSGAAGAGASITLRGGTSLQRDNQPLFVVDGIIYDNSTSIGGNSAFDGAQVTASTYSNRVMDINPEDIESMSVLKGPAAAALYGSKASSGAIIITTKKGQEGAVEINFNTKFGVNWVNRYPEEQSTYKRGLYNSAGTIEDQTNLESWGDKFGANETVYNNIRDFYDVASSWDNTLSVSGGTKTGNFYLSASRFDQNGIVPGTGYDKTTFRINGEQRVGLFTLGANIAYSQANTDKTLTSGGLWTASGSGGNGAMQTLYSWPRSMDVNNYLNEDGSKIFYYPGLALESQRDNPNWIINRNNLSDFTERVTGSIYANMDITDWMSLNYRLGIDSYLLKNNMLIEANTAIQPDWQDGVMSESNINYQYISSSVMLNIHKTFGDFDVNLLLGQIAESSKSQNNRMVGWKFIVPEFYSFANIVDANKRMESTSSQRRLVGAYGELRLGYKNMLYLTVTGRNDWSSTLPVENRSYFYPSVSGSFVFSELLPKNNILSFGKLRASWAKVGKDAAAYATNTYIWGFKDFLGDIVATGNHWQQGNAYLRPEMTTSFEIGLEMRFLNGRIGFDYTYYNNDSNNQILSPRLSQTIGYIFSSINAGHINNKGMELSISGTPFQTRDFRWDTMLNFAGNRGTVPELYQGLETLYITDVQVGNAKAASYNEGVFMAISGSTWSRDPNGNVILDEKTGMPTSDNNTTHYIGNREPKMIGGFNNSLQYRNWNLSLLFDYRIGGNVYNGTEYYMTVYGTSKLSENRESLTINGVVNKGTADNPNYQPDSFTYKAGESYDIGGTLTSGKKIIQDYWKTYYPRESANFMYKTNWLRLRSLTVTYNLPDSILAKQNIFKGVSASIIGSNLFLWTNYKGMDPEASAGGAGMVGPTSSGIEYCGVPATAGVSFSLNLRF